jgi:hypothetical protein
MSTATATANGKQLIERDVQDEVAREERLFELAQRKAKIYASSSLVPKEYHNNIGNVLIAENMAKRMGADTLMVMQNLYVVHGRPAWSSQFLIASFNSCGRFSAIRYRSGGDAGAAGSWCQAYCTELSTGELIEGPRITWEMAKAEGWVDKNGSKWKTMPEQMFRYRAASFLIRTTAPEIGMGLLTADEAEDSVIDSTCVPRPKTIDDITDRLRGPVHQVEESSGESQEQETATTEVDAAPTDAANSGESQVNEYLGRIQEANRKETIESVLALAIDDSTLTDEDVQRVMSAGNDRLAVVSAPSKSKK